MGVILVAIMTRAGGFLVSRQYCDGSVMDKERVESILRTFTSLSLTSTDSHCLEDGEIRYLYTPINNGAHTLVMVTTWCSNIIQDMATLTLLRRAVSEVLSGSIAHAQNPVINLNTGSPTSVLQNSKRTTWAGAINASAGAFSSAMIAASNSKGAAMLPNAILNSLGKVDLAKMEFNKLGFSYGGGMRKDTDLNDLCLEICLAFDEVLSCPYGLGQREPVSAGQLAIYLGMESLEEQIQEQLTKSKTAETKEAAKRRARQIDMDKREASKRGMSDYPSPASTPTVDTFTMPAFGVDGINSGVTSIPSSYHQSTRPVSRGSMKLGRKI